MGNTAGFSRSHRTLFAVAFLAASPAFASECPAVTDIAFDGAARGFTQTRTLPSLPNPILSIGVLQASEDTFVWQICEPFDIRTEIDGNGIRQSVEGGPETSPGPAFVQDTIRKISIADIFRGRFDELETTFKVHTAENTKNNADWRVTLVPYDQTIGAVIDHIRVTGCQAIDAVSISYRDGGRDDIAVGAVQPQNERASCLMK